MRKIALVLVVVGAAACGGSKMSKGEAQAQLDQLTTLYQENRPKFVSQKQEIVQADSCDRASALREAADDKAKAAAMSPENTDTITAVQMEMAQAEKDCLAK
jgi:hypothetical protein